MKNPAKLIILITAIAVLCFALSGFTVVVAYADNADAVYLGGIPLGIGLMEKGLIITGIADVITDSGAVSPTRGSGISTGDVIIKADGVGIISVEHFSRIVQESTQLELELIRGDYSFTAVVSPATDSLSGKKKLGIFVKKGVNGIGTLTYAKIDTNRFGALGHNIIDSDTGKALQSTDGSIYSCSIDSSVKGSDGKPGELLGRINREVKLGTVDKSTTYGIYGEYNKSMLKGLNKISLGSRGQVKQGKAYIYTTIQGNTPKLYQIEIIKANTQNTPAEKGLVIRIVDNELLAATGGILQGMSGSPIIQNNKLIGAVTHVLINDSTKGYGVYIDWMINN